MTAATTGRRGAGWTGTLTARIAALAAGIAVLAVLSVGLFSWRLLESAARAEVLASVSRQADLAANLVSPDVTGDLETALRTIRAGRTPVAWTGPTGKLAGDQPARLAYTRVGEPTTAVTRWVVVDGQDMAVAVRPLMSGRTLVMAEAFRRSDTLAWAAFRQILAVLAVATAVATGVAVWWSRRLGRPVRNAADAAHRLADGDRAVRVAPGGPTEIRELGAAVNRLADSLAHSEGRQRQFLTHVSHELRTPLTAVLGYGESLADGILTGPENTREAGATIVAETRRLTRLVDDLLALARTQADTFRFDIAEVDLAALLTDAAAVWRRRCDSEQVAFGYDGVAGPAVVATDAARLRQVIDNLVENALRVTPAGGRIAMTLTKDDTGYAIAVTDTGPGLSAQDRAVAFEPGALWERARATRRVGTGIGLALVRELVTGLGGSVTVAPADGAEQVERAEPGGPGGDGTDPGMPGGDGTDPPSGTRFTVRLPDGIPVTSSRDSQGL